MYSDSCLLYLFNNNPTLNRTWSMASLDTGIYTKLLLVLWIRKASQSKSSISGKKLGNSMEAPRLFIKLPWIPSQSWLIQFHGMKLIKAFILKWWYRKDRQPNGNNHNVFLKGVDINIKNYKIYITTYEQINFDSMEWIEYWYRNNNHKTFKNNRLFPLKTPENMKIA